MGLHIVELIMRLEEEYQIEIGDEEACELVTCGDMFLCVARKKGLMPDWNEVSQPQQPQTSVSALRAPGCASSRSFYRVRRALIQISGRERRQIGPKTRLNTLFPLHQRQQFWDQLQKELGQDVPSYWGRQWPEALLPTLIFSPLLLPRLVGVYWPLTLLVYLLLLTFYIRPMLSDMLTSPLNTVGDLSLCLLAREERREVSAQTVAQNQLEWGRFRVLVAQETEMDVSQIQPTTRLVEDLNY